MASACRGYFLVEYRALYGFGPLEHFGEYRDTEIGFTVRLELKFLCHWKRSERCLGDVCV
jgi:hypothetical protein